ncbi:tRNA (guanosine(46)-N7)-methyltransferase TrmB [Nitrosomonas sp. JL21]|uniref:tRNA (guanosine(46)-N7)-methyltransferase TrmB n=1 Tax=Nitrosomonas sp. JL21 TaxID=153949 RepID=UPI00136D7651|nr:tRNA (guanosine(46)-N7)-methyltransferase TrmB [Nitrosomonas sp. JL21]MBL8497848.1 tRNA (guanosine(46)-N7)-methyltransferase TrmB [Nitrosomonas sp.]MCC7091883.1 tRNA (guanosine(46)-N7)-methyltransferase TrmB [Nitrosomonas sp.]MXS76795.1 tRNA (guanosine(46)-N7)-methyltransferase TrmB [Nitrosomonas sp. JL21]
MHQAIRSFVLRQGRLSNAQQRACETLLPRYGIPFSEHLLDLDQVFGRQAPKILEIGFGMGESTAAIAQAHPDIDYLGIEVHTPGVGSLLNRIDSLGLTNLRIIQHDAVAVIQHMLAVESLSGIHIFFPDPWPKARHHKRRLIQPALIASLCQRLKTGGYLHAATDWEDYAIQILQVLSQESGLTNTAADYASRPDYRPLTKFEQRGLKLGHGVWDLIFRKTSD